MVDQTAELGAAGYCRVFLSAEKSRLNVGRVSAVLLVRGVLDKPAGSVRIGIFLYILHRRLTAGMLEVVRRRREYKPLKLLGTYT